MCESPLKGISSSLRDASLYPKDIGRRRVTLEEVHSANYDARRSRLGEFMEVRVLHSFVVKKNRMFECNFILADQTDYIAAIAFCEVGTGSGDFDSLPEIYKKLKVNVAYRIHHFQVELQASTRTRQVFLLRNQVKRINLSHFVRYIENIPSHELEISPSFKKYISFSFTEFDGVDRNLDGKLIDFVAFVKNILFDMLPDGRYQRILQLSRAMPDPSNSPMKENDKHLYLRVTERFVDVFLTKESPYIFSNIKVKDGGSYGLKLITTVHTIIVEIPLDNVKLAFPEDYKDADFISYLYRSDTPTGSNTDDLQGSVDNLSRRLSQPERPYLDLKAQVELSPQPTATLLRVHETPEVKVEPPTNPAESHISPNKRNHSSLESTSPSKKVCQTPSQPLTEVLPSASQEEDTMHTPAEFYDCEHGGYPYVVNVKLANSFMDNKPGENYSTRSEIRGVALIINNVFDGEEDLERRGTLKDVERLRDLLIHFGFLVIIKTDLQSWQVRGTIGEVKHAISEIGVSHIDSLFVAVLSHGELGSVQMTDGISVHLYNDIIHPFDEQSFPVFEGKPKIFVVQTCLRHPDKDTIKTIRSVLTPPARTGMKNIIVCQGACPGQYSYRNPTLGTYMIYVLVFVMMRDAHNTHFEKMMKSVQQKMDAIKWDLNKELTCTWVTYHFKKMYFNPGLFEKNENLCVEVVKKCVDRLERTFVVYKKASVSS